MVREISLGRAIKRGGGGKIRLVAATQTDIISKGNAKKEQAAYIHVHASRSGKNKIKYTLAV